MHRVFRLLQLKAPFEVSLLGRARNIEKTVQSFLTLTEEVKAGKFISLQVFVFL